MSDDNKEIDKILADAAKKEIFIIEDGKKEILTEEKLKRYADELLESLITEHRRRKDVGITLKVEEAVTNLKKVWYPATLKTVSLSIDPFKEKLDLFLSARKDLVMKRNIITVKPEEKTEEQTIDDR